MTVTFWSGFSKRINSTVRPSTTGTDHDCKLKEDCSEHDTVLVLQSTADYDYAYISTWGKYYFVRDRVSKSNTISEYYLTEDPLATYKTYIGNMTARVIYAATAVHDPWLVDPRIQIKNSKTIAQYNHNTNVTSNTSGYILTVYNNAITANSSGFSVSYLLSEIGMSKVREWFARVGVSDVIAQFFNGNPLSGVLGCIWVPYFNDLIDSSNTYTVPASYMAIGSKWSNDSPAIVFNTGELYVIKNYSILEGYNYISIPHIYNDFRRYAPYTSAALYLPGVGVVGINKQEYPSGNLSILYYIEVITGAIKYYVMDAGSGSIVNSYDGNIASQCPLGQITTNATGVVSSIGATLGGVVSLAGAAAVTAATEGATAPMLTGAAASVIAGVANTVLSFNQHSASVVGNNGSRLAFKIPYIHYFEVAVDTEDPTDASYVMLKGYPHAGTAQISSFGGFIQCEGASVICPGNPTEKEEINNYLNTGFFYE